jgi:hypothetical protein
MASKRRGSLWIHAALVLVLGADAYATDYYVSPSGSDGNSGTSPQSAWQTTSKVSNFNFSAGDRILFEGGQSFPGTINFDAHDHGTAASPIIVTSYGAGRTKILAGSGAGLYAYNTAGIEIRSIDFRGGGASANQANGIYFYMDLGGGQKLDHIVLDDVDISGFGYKGIQIGSWHQTKSGFRNVQVTHVASHDNGLAGMVTWGYFSSTSSGWSHQNIYVADSSFYNNPGSLSVTNLHTGDGIYLSDVDGATIEYCQAYENGDSCGNPNGGPVGIWAWDANDVTIQYCESHHNHTGPSSVDGGGFDLDGGATNSVVQYNYSHDNEGAGYLLAQFSGARPFHGNTVRYNISENDGRAHDYGAIALWNGNGSNGVTNTQIYNNTVFMIPAPSSWPSAISLLTPVSNVWIRNNIVSTMGGLDVVSSVGNPGATFQGNDYFSYGSQFNIEWGGVYYHTLQDWRAATGEETLLLLSTGHTYNPSLVRPGTGGTIGDPHALGTLTAYQLLSGSRMINGALNLLTNFGIDPGPQDFYGTSVPMGARFDTGACEWPGPSGSNGR